MHSTGCPGPILCKECIVLWNFRFMKCEATPNVEKKDQKPWYRLIFLLLFILNLILHVLLRTKFPKTNPCLRKILFWKTDCLFFSNYRRPKKVSFRLRSVTQKRNQGRFPVTLGYAWLRMVTWGGYKRSLVEKSGWSLISFSSDKWNFFT